MNISAGAKTDTGQRANNEDRYAVVDTRKRQIRADGVLIIADGMGGRSFGEQAAAAAVETTEDALAELLDNRQVDEVIVADALATALRRANARVYELASADDERKGMGTTCVAAVVEGDRLYVAHAGDSRAYLLRDGLLRQITHDHSYVAEQVRAGAITEEGARSSRFRNIITRAIGIEPTIDAEVSEADVQPGDMVLLCTDGLSNIVAEEDITRALMQASSPQAAADKLVQMAVKSGGRDNITAVVARLQAGTRTLRMQVADLVRPAPQTVSEMLLSSEPHSNGTAAGLNAAPRRSALWPAVSAVLLVVTLAALAWAGWLTQTMAHPGGTISHAPSDAVRPALTPPSPAVDLAHLSYDPPKGFGFSPVRGSFLLVSPADGTVTVASLTGQIIALTSTGGQVRYKYRLPFIKAQSASPAGALGADGVTLHTATDPQGNLYVSNAVTKTVTKYGANGVSLGLIAHLSLKNPQAIGVAADGTLYLIDSNRLEVLHVHPSSKPLPPVPAPAPPPPAALPTASIPVSGHGYRHYGYHHYGYRR
jgi:serine/threonine protein phosphatase PrpC